MRAKPVHSAGDADAAERDSGRDGLDDPARCDRQTVTRRRAPTNDTFNGIIKIDEWLHAALSVGDERG